MVARHAGRRALRNGGPEKRLRGWPRFRALFRPSALAAWIQQHGHDMAGPPRELYLVGPGQAATPADLRTEVVWPIR